MNGEKTRHLLLWQNGMHVIIEWEMYRFQMVLENELDRLFQRFCIHWFHLRLEWPLCICTEMMDSHTVMNGMCDTKKGVTCLSVIIWRSVEELRCLFVREGWSECFLGLWRDSCSWMPLEEPHRWDGACLNIIHSGWESLSRVMWWGKRNVKLYWWSVMSVVSLGKSSQSIHSLTSTSHYQCAWITPLEYECLLTHLNGSQFRQV